MSWDGVLAPITTPFDADGDVNIEGLKGNIRKYNATGLRGYVVGGSTGEVGFLSHEERLRVLAAARESAEGKVLIAGTGRESVRETIGLTRAAADIGYDAALVLTPHYYRAQMARPETQMAFFHAVADASPIPIFIYDIPQNTGIDLDPETVRRIAGHPNVVGIKESKPDLEKVASLCRTLPDTVAVFAGASGKFFDCLAAGASGGILAIADAAPREAVRIYERFSKGDRAGAQQAQAALADAASVAPQFWIQGLKYAMELKGYYGGPSRPPFLPIREEQKREIERLFEGVAACATTAP